MMSTNEGNDGKINSLKNSNAQDLFIIGVGASAGGLDPIYSLFEKPTPNNASFVIIQHFPPDFKSNMAMLLAKHSKRQIHEVKDNVKLEPNSVYVMVERKNIAVRQGRLFLIDEDREWQRNNPIDSFLKSLAEEKGDKSIAIILSGANKDGTEGAEAIKNAGGRVIVQDPATAQYSVMPDSVIASGNADVILSPELIPAEVIHYLKEKSLLDQYSGNNEAALLEILNKISSKTQLDFSNYKRPTIIRRITRRLMQHNIDSLEDYILFLEKDQNETDILAKELMISVTSFFRDPQAFEVVKKKVLPDVIQGKQPNEIFKIWVIGCATGEEAYSIAILVDEYLTEINKHLNIKIFASDIDQNALAVASRGIYPESIVHEVSEERISKYFQRQGDKFKINEKIRSMIVFAYHDITRHPPYYKLDFISCRNVLIYMGPELQEKVLNTLHFCLNKEGYLFLGYSEYIANLKTKVDEVDKKWKIYKNVHPAVRESGNFPLMQYANPLIQPTSLFRPQKDKAPPQMNLDGVISEVVLQHFGYAGVCVDEHFTVVQTFGEYTKFLLPDMFNFNLLEILPKELSIGTGVSLRQAVKENKEIKLNGITFKQNDKLRSVDVIIIPLSERKSSEKFILVFFNERIPEKPEIENVEVFHKETHFSRYIADLEEDIKDKEEKLKEAHEALEVCFEKAQSYNEELISSNEELISSNEELQSTSEEIQFVNKELQNINNQYQEKIGELEILNDDLNNYFRSAEYSQIYVDRNLIIRKFTPKTMREVNIKESDIGRPISDITTNIKFSTFIEDIKSVLKSVETSEKEIQTTDEKWYLMRIIPYIRRQDNKADGAIITFNDVTGLKEFQKKLMKINLDHNTFIYSVSHDLNAPISNISGLISIMETLEPGDQNFKKMLELINLSVQRLKETIVELSDITKIEKESMEETREMVNLNDLLEEIKLSINEMLTRSKAKINLDFQVTELSYSKKNLRSILFNLLTNAIKYRSPVRNPVINLRTKLSGNFLILSVEDNGGGISKENQEKIFSKFQRVNVKDKIEGAGVGLYLIKKMVENAGGKIKVESEEGKGSTFTVCFKV